MEEVIYEKGYFFLFIFTFYEGVSLLSGLSSQAYQGNGILAPIWQDSRSNERSIAVAKAPASASTW